MLKNIINYTVGSKNLTLSLILILALTNLKLYSEGFEYMVNLNLFNLLLFVFSIFISLGAIGYYVNKNRSIEKEVAIKKMKMPAMKMGKVKRAIYSGTGVSLLIVLFSLMLNNDIEFLDAEKLTITIIMLVSMSFSYYLQIKYNPEGLF